MKWSGLKSNWQVLMGHGHSDNMKWPIESLPNETLFLIIWKTLYSIDWKKTNRFQSCWLMNHIYDVWHKTNEWNITVSCVKIGIYKDNTTNSDVGSLKGIFSVLRWRPCWFWWHVERDAVVHWVFNTKQDNILFYLW